MSVRPDRQFSICYSSYKGYRAVPSLESYTSSSLELRLELQLDIGSDHGYLDYEPQIFGFYVIIRSPYIRTVEGTEIPSSLD